jgi:FSR family fosmidomycin resistance protein-like MFS transporter
MTFSLFGLLLLSRAGSLGTLLMASALIGVGSAVFHPESSRVARMASGGRHGLAQSVFQVGGNIGSSLGPLLAAFLVLPRGQSSIAWASGVALLAIAVLWKVGGWSSHQHRAPRPKATEAHTIHHPEHISVSQKRVRWSIVVLVALIFSKYFYLASLTNYYTFYLINHFHVTVQSAQIDLFIFLGAVAAGTILGGPIGDRFGRKLVIWVSILGVFPFTFALPYANLFLDADPPRSSSV